MSMLARLGKSVWLSGQKRTSTQTSAQKSYFSSLSDNRKKQKDPNTRQMFKQPRGRMKGISSSGNSICFGTYALQALKSSWITARQIEAGRRAIARNVGRGGKIWVRIFPDKPVTVRPTETRMGRGKGSPAYWVAVVKPTRILYEIGGVAENVARKAIQIAASKMPIQTQFRHIQKVCTSGECP